MEDAYKRKPPTMIKQILQTDEYMTSQFIKFMEKFPILKQLKVHYRLLEISCHGLLWIPFWTAFIWLLNSKDLYQVQVNLLLGLFLDIIIVAIIKAYTRRRRPLDNDDPFGFGPDKFSFPSGHASRCLMIVYFFIRLWGVHSIFYPPLVAWTVSLCVSRLLMRRHHILDIVAGVLLGLIEGVFMELVYLDKETCINLISWITDEKLDGGEYHV